MKTRARACIGLLWSAMALGATAGTGQAHFDVDIVLSAYTPVARNEGSCTSGATSGFADATVSVVCSGNEFVSIVPGPDAPTRKLLGRTHRFQLSGLQEPHPLTAHLGANGSVGQATALRVMNIQGTDTALHMRVDF